MKPPPAAMSDGTAPFAPLTDSPEASRCRLTVTGMDCADCARTIEASLAAMPGVAAASVNFARGIADVAYDPARVARGALVGRVQALGYGVAPPERAGAPWLFAVSGMDCAECARTVETAVRRLPGVGEASLNFASATLSVVPSNDALTQNAVAAAIQRAGYTAEPRGDAPARDGVRWWRTRRLLEAALAAVLWVVGFGVEHAGAPRWASAIPFLAAMVVAGYPVARAAWYALRARRADMNLLMTIAAVGAIAIGQWDEGASVLILFAIGLTLQSLTLDRTRRALQALVRLAPRQATVKRDGRERLLPVGEVAVGDEVVVRPGERVPVDGVVLAGHSAVDQAPITGESVPVAVAPGATVFAGSINGDGALDVRATKPASDTTLARIIHLVDEAQASKAPAQALVDRFAAVYTPAVVAGALLLAVAGPLLTDDVRGWIFKALVLLVIACPCALVISTPVALVAAIGSASRRGILFKGGAALEALAGVRTVAFDKTGTLTAGRPAVADVVPLDGRTGDEVLARAAAVEQRASHPIARAIVATAHARSLPIPLATDVESIPGRGARALVVGEPVTVGSARLFGAIGTAARDQLDALEEDGKTAVLVGTDRTLDGIVAVADPVRAASRAAVLALHRLGLRTVMLTGDNGVTAARVGAATGVADVRAGLLPEDKVTAVAELQAVAPVAMVGDGINDAPALATAAVGIAMGAAGTDVAIEAADVALMGDDVALLPVAVRLARRTLAVIRQNVAAALLVKALVLALTFVGVANLWLAVLADTGVSLAVTANALRLLRSGAVPGDAAGDAAPHGWRATTADGQESASPGA